MLKYILVGFLSQTYLSKINCLNWKISLKSNCSQIFYTWIHSCVISIPCLLKILIFNRRIIASPMLCWFLPNNKKNQLYIPSLLNLLPTLNPIPLLQAEYDIFSSCFFKFLCSFITLNRLLISSYVFRALLNFKSTFITLTFKKYHNKKQETKIQMTSGDNAK